MNEAAAGVISIVFAVFMVWFIYQYSMTWGFWESNSLIDIGGKKIMSEMAAGVISIVFVVFMVWFVYKYRKYK